MNTFTDFAALKKFFLYCFVGGIIAAAVVTVITLLVGQFNDVTTRVFMTLGMVVVHSLISLAFIWDDTRRNTFESLSFFVNVIFAIIVMSFVLSLFWIWQIVSMDNALHTYQLFFYIGFAALHGNMLAKAMGREGYMDKIIEANFLFIVIVLLMLLPIVYQSDIIRRLGEGYYRFLAAAGVVDGTLSILTIIFYKLYLHNHPKAPDPIMQSTGPTKGGSASGRGLSVWVWILLVYLAFQVIMPLMWFLRMSLGGRYY